MRERRVEWRELDDVAVAEQVVGQSVSDRVITLGKLLGCRSGTKDLYRGNPFQPSLLPANFQPEQSLHIAYILNRKGV